MTTREDLSAEEDAALEAIVGGRLAWTEMGELIAAGHAEATLLGLAGLGLVARWTTRSMDAATLTPYGAWLMGVEIVERVRIVGEDLEEDPVWTQKPATPPRLRLPRRAHEVRYPWMETFPDPLPGPEYLVDEESGKPIELFAQLFDGRPVAGVKIVIDRRMRGKKGARKAG